MIVGKADTETDFSDRKILPEEQPGFNGSFEEHVVGALLADDLIELLAHMVVEIERSSNTT